MLATALLPAVLALGGLTAGDAAAPPARPSVLVHCPRRSVDQWYWWVDLRYLSELHARGFEVDYTDRHEDFTWERVSQYDVLVLYTVPAERGAYYDNSPDSPPFRDEFVSTVERYLEAGGGVLLMARSINADETFLPLIQRWGARIPHEHIVEDDPRNVVPTPRMRGAEKLWFTDNVPASPVSRGVRQVWLPFTRHYSAAETMPIAVDGSWQVVLRGSSTSRTAPVDLSATRTIPPPDRFVRDGGVREPPLFAIRNYAAGRLAFGAVWPQYSIGQGTEWLYDRRVLSKGVGGRPSHFGRLIENTLRWLAEPGLATDAVGGYITRPRRLVAPNEREGVREGFVERSRRQPPAPVSELAVARNRGPILRGLIGAQSELGSGSGSVADYARVGRESGLQFVVFLEDFSRLDEARLARLKAECARHSADDLRLWPGYRIETNTGNRMFIYGDRTELPPDGLVFEGRLNQQWRDPGTGEYRHPSPLIDWLNYRLLGSKEVNVGYYGFADRPLAQGLEDLRFYSAVALRLFHDGEAVEDNLEAYLATAAGTLPPTPVAVHLLRSPESLAQAVRRRIGLTYVQAPQVGDLWRDLGYAGLYDAPDVFVSDGPMIFGWPAQLQYYTFAAERFVTAEALMRAPILVRSDVGLKEIRIYDGDRLFRRFLAGGESSFELVLELTASVHKTLILVAEDVDGGVAVSSARRAWKGGGLAPSFCGDRVNHCATLPLMAKGPGIVQVSRAPAIAAGHTWDGGPEGEQPVLALIDANRPALRTNRGAEGERGFNNRAVLELADEGAVRVRSVLETLYDRRIPVANPWRTFGPLEGPSRLFRSEVVLTVFNRPTIGPHPDLFPGLARRTGAWVTLFENEITFRQDLRVDSLQLFRQKRYGGAFPVVLVQGRGEKILRRFDLSSDNKLEDDLLLARGDWIGAFGAQPTNLAVLWNRGETLRLIPGASRGGLPIRFVGEVEPRQVRQGQRRVYEVLSAVDPIDAPLGGAERVLEIVGYLRDPKGLRVPRGRARIENGLVELNAIDGAVAVKLDRPEQQIGIPLPVRVSGLNRRWSAGIELREGYVLGNYGKGRSRYRDAGIDRDGRAYATLFPDRSGRTHVAIGHPVVCDQEDLFIQVTRKDDLGRPASWHVSLNNPTDHDMETRCHVAMKMPGLKVADDPVRIPAGGYRVLP